MTGPFIVTHRQERGGAVRFGSSGEPEVLFRKAFATLEEAQAALARRIGGAVDRGPEISQAHDAIDALPEFGGRLPLLDGSVIEVEATKWQRLIDDLGYGSHYNPEGIPAQRQAARARDSILAAWNAKHGIGIGPDEPLDDVEALLADEEVQRLHVSREQVEAVMRARGFAQ